MLPALQAVSASLTSEAAFVVSARGAPAVEVAPVLVRRCLLAQQVLRLLDFRGAAAGLSRAQSEREVNAIRVPFSAAARSSGLRRACRNT